ncbi:MAG TPA: hypothetical protein PKA64_16830 [Myxococcota bacterium]|nr:hypothetical protein [Myxococcota bacterium]
MHLQQPLDRTPASSPDRRFPRGAATRLAQAASIALTAGVATPARAAEVTDLPPKFRGDVHVAYGGSFQQVGIAESAPDGTDRTFAVRNTVEHDLTFRLEGAVWKGVVVTLGLPITVQQRIFYPTDPATGLPAAREMLYEPSVGVGSFANGQPFAAPEYTSGGLQGAWIGVAVAPTSEHYRTSLPITSRLDLAVRTPGAKSTLYGQSRGASPGGAAIRLAGAFSAERGKANPYTSFSWTHELPATVPEVYDNEGHLLATDVAVRGDDKFDANLGAELVVREKPGTDLRVAIDVYAGFGYRGWQDMPSGFYLPDVLDISRGQTVTRSEYLLARGGLALDWAINRWAALRLGAEGRYITPHRIEDAYSAHTDPQSYEVGWTFGLVGRIRTKDDPATL